MVRSWDKRRQFFVSWHINIVCLHSNFPININHLVDLAGETPFDDAIVDMLGDQVQDGYTAMYKDVSRAE
jgi:hypothetical protein